MNALPLDVAVADLDSGIVLPHLLFVPAEGDLRLYSLKRNLLIPRVAADGTYPGVCLRLINVRVRFCLERNLLGKNLVVY